MGKNNELDNITYPVYKKLVKRASVVYPVDNISNMSDNDINNLKAGDVVVKKTGNQRHSYVVSYKEDKQGICLTYVDGSGYMETISYDYSDGHWVYNSKDVFNGATKEDVKLENIKDKHGNKRFIEGAIEIVTTEGVSLEYGKWSLSGTHLMIVIVLTATNGSTINSGKIADINIPSWIKNKIYPLYGTNRVDRNNILMYADNETYQTLSLRLLNDSTAFRINVVSDLTLTANRSGRIEFDLLIDAE